MWRKPAVSGSTLSDFGNTGITKGREKGTQLEKKSRREKGTQFEKKSKKIDGKPAAVYISTYAT
jgi:hypothetical protein